MRRYLKLLRYASPYRGFLLVLFVMALFAAAVAALLPWPMKLVVDALLGHDRLPTPVISVLQKLSISLDSTTLLPVFVLAGLALYLLNSGLDAALAWGWTWVGRRTVNDVARDVFDRMQRRSLSFHRRNEVGNSISRVMVDSWCVYQLLHAVCFTAVYALLMIATMIVLMALLQPMLMLITVATVPLMVGAAFVLGKRLRAAAKEKREIETRIQSHVQQTLTGLPVVQSFVQEERELAAFRAFAAQAIEVQQRSTFFGGLGGLSSGLVTTLGTGVIIFVAARFVIEGKLTVGGLLVFLAYLTALQAQAKTLAGVYPIAQNVSASVDRVNELLDTPTEILDGPEAVVLAQVSGHVRFENVTAGYEPNRLVLNDISLEVRAGQTVAIVGPAGVGKSTLVSLIPRFFDPWSGRVLLDGHDVRELRVDWLRSQVAMVLQEPFLFPVSVAENIAFGRAGVTREEVEEAARAANADEFVRKLPSGYDTVLGERGMTLSGGERQRIAIARAMVRKAPILILDEPTSALDADTEKLLLAALQRAMAGRTTFIIAHRLSTLRSADQIVVMDAGRIQEMSTHDELLAKNGLYARLYQLQFGVLAEPTIAGARP